MGGAAAIMMWFTHGVVDMLIIFYSINVFITFSLSQAGMVRHWWQVRATEPKWKGGMAINSLGLVLTGGILVMLSCEKFFEGGWATLLVTAVLTACAFLIRRHYDDTKRRLQRLDSIVAVCDEKLSEPSADTEIPINAKARTAIILVNGYNGLGLHTLLNVPRLFGDTYRNYIFVQVGVVDAGNFKGSDEIETLRKHTEESAHRYVRYARAHGFGAEAYTAVTHDATGEILAIARKVSEKYKSRVFFGGQLIFSKETFVTRFLHNHLVFLLQRRFFLENIPFVIVPIRVGE
jgi:hypothetical protein